jgi:hypothetical protein
MRPYWEYLCYLFRCALVHSRLLTGEACSKLVWCHATCCAPRLGLLCAPAVL